LEKVAKMSKRSMHLVAYLKTGPSVGHFGGWRHPEASLEMFDPRTYEHLARLFEAAKFDGIFFADALGVIETFKGSFDHYLRVGGQTSYLDPMIVLPLMARVTTHLGLGATISSSLHHPYQTARQLASLDMISNGRAAWNVVTSTTDVEAQNVGLSGIFPHDERYDRADEVLEACTALWRSWDSDPFVFDKEAGIFADPAKLHHANYEGRWIKTRGPLGVPRSPQGQPVIMQAGASDRGRQFAARWAEMIFATPGTDKETMRAHAEDMRHRLVAAGRDPSACKLLMGITPIIGETESIARERAEYLDSLQDPQSDIAYASTNSGADLTRYKTAEEIIRARGHQGSHSATETLKRKALQENMSVERASAKRQVEEALIGTPSMIADMLEDLFLSRACDGFILRPMTIPTSYEQFCRAVTPELQRRGLFRKEYSASTLRGHLQD